MLASVAIDDAVSAGVDPTRIDKAAKERQAGDRDAADMKVESAIERYRNAWQHVVR
jgi:hypothetical protein